MGAYRRAITARTKLLYQQHKFSPPFSHINHHNHNDDDIKNSSIPAFTDATKIPAFIHNTSFTSRRVINHQGFPFTPTQQFMHSMNFGSNFSRRNMSTGAGQGAEAVNTFEYLSDSADIFTDTASTAVEAVGAAVQVDPLVSEVAVAAADSFFPVAGLQYLIDYVHTFTGLQWWGAIVVSTLLIRLATTPLVVHQMKATSKFTLIRPRIEAIREEMQNRGMSPAAVAEGQQEMRNLFKKYGVSPFTPMKGLFVQGPVFLCFFLAITNMVEKVPSFKEGGAFWFTDLTTPDSMYILPVLTALTFWITVECNMQEGMEGNPAVGLIKNVSRGFAVLTIPLTASFAKAIFCYWITSNIYSLFLGLAIKNHSLKKALGIPIIPVTPYTPGEHKPAMGFFESMKKYAEAQAQAKKEQQLLSSSSAGGGQAEKTQKQQNLSSPGGGQAEETQKQQNLSSPAEASSKSARPSVPSSSILNQRIKSLEKEVKARKEGKKK